MRSSLQIVFGILFFLPLSQHTVLHAEIPSKVDVVAEIVQSLSQIDPKDRLELFYIVGRDAAQLTEEEWEPIHRLCKEAATANFAQSGAPGELVRDYAPGVALIQCGGIKSADSLRHSMRALRWRPFGMCEVSSVER